MIIPPHLGPHDRITIELHEMGPDDGRRVGAPACVLVDGLQTMPRYRPTVTDLEPEPLLPVDLRITWQWDGSTTDDGAYRFRHRK